MIFLFTDFGCHGPYLGQMRAALHREAPQVPVFDLLNNAPAFDPQASAHLLAALAAYLPANCVVVAVVDPGVGGARLPLAVRAGGRWFVGPDNGLFDVVAARAGAADWHEIVWRPRQLSASFHGRDLFAPVAARLAAEDAAGNLPADWLRLLARPLPRDGECAAVIYIDDYGNAMTGLRAGRIEPGASLLVAGQRLAQARSFEAVPAGAAFWYGNSLGLVEVALNQGSAARSLDLAVGSTVSVA